MNDPYQKSIRYYERYIDGMNKGLKLIGIRMFRPIKGMRILDMGCGTGTHLELYQRYHCNLYGLDVSPSMLEAAHTRLGSSAYLGFGDARHIPYKDASFDLVIIMLTLHEMPAQARAGALDEIKRVLKQDGRILLIDFHTGPYQPLQGWISRGIILLSEIAVGKEHFRNFRNFMAGDGLARLIEQHSLRVEKEQILAGGTFRVCLAAR